MVALRSRCWPAALLVASLCCSLCLATPLPPPPPAQDGDANGALLGALGDLLEGASPADGFRVDVLEAPAASGGEQAVPTRQLSPTTQSFLSTLGTALGPIVGAIIGPLLTNIGQNLSSGSGAQAIAQLQQAAQAAVAAQQQQPQGGSAVVAAAAAAVAESVSGLPSSAPAATPPPTTPKPPAGRPSRRPSSPRPAVRPSSSRPAPASPSPTPQPTPLAPAAAPVRQSFDAFVLDVPGKGPFLFLMTPNATAAEQSTAIQQAQQQAAQLLAVNGQPSPIGAVASLIGTTPSPQPQVSKPTSVGPLPVRPGFVAVTPAPPVLPSYHSLLPEQGGHEDEDGHEEVAVAEAESADHAAEEQEQGESGFGETKDEDSDFSSQSFLERLFPEMI